MWGATFFWNSDRNAHPASKLTNLCWATEFWHSQSHNWKGAVHWSKSLRWIWLKHKKKCQSLQNFQSAFIVILQITFSCWLLIWGELVGFKLKGLVGWNELSYIELLLVSWLRKPPRKVVKGHAARESVAAVWVCCGWTNQKKIVCKAGSGFVLVFAQREEPLASILLHFLMQWERGLSERGWVSFVARWLWFIGIWNISLYVPGMP